jgi:hypothetical protein
LCDERVAFNRRVVGKVVLEPLCPAGSTSTHMVKAVP